MKQLKVILIGAGNRGRIYCRHMKNMPEKYQLVGVAEPHDLKRTAFAEEYGIPEEARYKSWEDILSVPKMADIAVIATNDDCHYEPVMKAIELGYHILLEKPVAQTAEHCTAMAMLQRKRVFPSLFVMCFAIHSFIKH